MDHIDFGRDRHFEQSDNQRKELVVDMLSEAAVEFYVSSRGPDGSATGRAPVKPTAPNCKYQASRATSGIKFVKRHGFLVSTAEDITNS